MSNLQLLTVLYSICVLCIASSQTSLSTTPCVKQQNEFQSSQLQNISTRWMNGTKTARNELDSKSCRPIRLVPVFASSCTLTFTIVTQQTVSWLTVNLLLLLVERPALAVRLDLSFRSVYFYFFSGNIFRTAEPISTKVCTVTASGQE